MTERSEGTGWLSTGRVAVVSGGSRGLGRVLVERLLADGWSVATFSRSDSDFVKRTRESAGCAFYWRSADLADPESLQDFLTGAVRRFPRIDLLINNAAVLDGGLFLTTPARRIGTSVAVNLVAPMILARGCARAMVRDRGGTIVNVSSINAIRGHRGVAAYSAAKAGLHGFSRSLARELGPFNIRVNAVVPGFFDSELTAHVSAEDRRRIVRRTPLGRLGTVDDIADVVLFLVSPAASFVTGQTIVVDGGITC